MERIIRIVIEITDVGLATDEIPQQLGEETK
jgi:hypothetical protein